VRLFGTVAAAAVVGMLAWDGGARAAEGEGGKAAPETFLSHPMFVRWWEAAKEKADLNDDGIVDGQEREQVRARLAERRQALRRAILERFDTDGDGRLTGPEMAAFRTCLAAHPLLRERLRWRDRVEDVRDRREDVRDRREDIRDRLEDRIDSRVRGGPLDRLEDVRDRREDVRDRREDVRDRLDGPPGPWWRRALIGPGARDRREDIRDRREDVLDRREDVRDRLEDRIDSRVQGGLRDELEDILDRMEDVRDRREDVRDRVEDRIDRRSGPGGRVRGPGR